MSLADDFERQLRTPTDIYEHLGTMAALALQLDAQKIIELGVRTGVSTVAWLFALEQTGGSLWSVDIDDVIVDTISERPPWLADRWRSFMGDDTASTTLVQMPEGADIVFIDTSHAYDHTRLELELYLPLIRPGGKFVLHDTEVEYPVDITDRIAFPVKSAVSEFCGAHKFSWVNHPNCNGLGVIDVP